MNYFNYFTEVEEHFRQARNSGMFMMSPLDWVLVESWKNAGIPLGAVLKGIDRSFEKYHSGKRRRFSTVNSVAYCSQEVLGAAREMAHGDAAIQQSTSPGFEPGSLAAFFRERAEQLGRVSDKGKVQRDLLDGVARSLEALAEKAEGGELGELEEVERMLTVLDDRLFAAATVALSEDQLLQAGHDLDAELKPYRRRMTAEQLGSLRQTYLRRKTFDLLGLPRLSLFHMG